MIKSEIRKQFKEKRLALSNMDVNVYQDLLLIRFQDLHLPYIQFLHSYIPMPSSKEPDPGPLVDWMCFRDPGLKTVYGVINDEDYSMQHFLYNEDTVFQLNRYGIPEPTGGTAIDAAQIDAVVMPLLAFDSNGDRVGYGKGYYDRFLAACRKDVLKIGLSYFPPVSSIDDIEIFDKKLDFCITPERVYAF
ncbi:MAG: 5-formyltetrahydrofolate cyclo-ligase [Bacteroidota bacterium]|jgi:5-formyltetrahydrofolate cyclo-ligase